MSDPPVPPQGVAQCQVSAFRKHRLWCLSKGRREKGELGPACCPLALPALLLQLQKYTIQRDISATPPSQRAVASRERQKCGTRSFEELLRAFERTLFHEHKIKVHIQCQSFHLHFT